MSARRIYTRSGDGGSTGLLSGARVSKTHPLIELLGCLDELSAVLGIAASVCRPAEPTRQIEDVQSRLLHLGALAAASRSGARRVPAAARQQPEPLAASEADATRHAPPDRDATPVEGWIAQLEEDIDRLEAGLPPLTAFLLPGGSMAAAALHHARTVCRRCERRAVAAAEAGDPLPPSVLAYLNRLGDWLFVAARSIHAREGSGERRWPVPDDEPPTE